MSFATGVRDVAYSLRAQGMTVLEIEAALKSRFPSDPTPSDTQIWRWLAEPEAQGLVKQEEMRIRATVAQQTGEIIGGTYQALREAVASRDFRATDAYSRAVVNLTRGFVQERVEVSARVETDQADELGAILARHGVRVLEQRVNGQVPDATDETQRGV